MRRRFPHRAAEVRAGRRRPLGGLALGVLAPGVLAAAMTCAPSAQAAQHPGAKLVSCADADCLLVSGARSDPQAQVLINGHPVEAEGRRSWKVLLPVETVRAWSASGARNIAVTTLGAGSDSRDTRQVKLPIGMLGSITELAVLVIR